MNGPLDLATLNALHANFKNGSRVQSTTQAAKKQKGKGGTATSLISEGGGLGGALAGGATGAAIGSVVPIVGTAIGGLVGAGIGGFLGGTGGRLAENKIRDNEFRLKDALKEGAVSGVMGAGPLRLAKFAGAGGMAAFKGAGLAGALAKGGESAVAPSIFKTAVASKLGSTSENLASKALGITKGQKNDILLKTGEKAGAIAKKYNITDASQVPGVVKPMYNEFSTAVSAIPRTFGKDEVGQAFKSVYEPLVADGTPLGSQAIGNRLKEEAANLLKGISKDGITASELNAKRQAFDKLAYKLKATDPSLADVNRQSRIVISNLIHSAADEHGVTTSAGTLKQLGNQISKIERLGKAANKNIEGAGGHMAIGVGSIPGAVVGSGAGPVGSAVGIAANQLLNSNVGRRTTSKVLDKISTKAASSAATKPFGLKAVAKREILGNGLASALGTAQSSSMSPTMDNAMTSTNTANTDMNQLSQNNPQNAITAEEWATLSPEEQQYQMQQAETTGFTTDGRTIGADITGGGGQATDDMFNPANLQGYIQKILSGGGTMKDVAQYLDIAQTVQKMQADSQPKAGKGLNSTQQQQAFNAQTGLDSLNNIQQALQANPNAIKMSSLPGGQFTAGLLGTSGIRADIANAADVIGRLRSGGAINGDEEKRFRSMLPLPGDDAQHALQKIQNVRSLLSKFANPQATAAPSQADLIAALGAQ